MQTIQIFDTTLRRQGRCVSTDVTGGSILALLAAVNRMLEAKK